MSELPTGVPLEETTEQRLRRERDEAVAFARSEGQRADTAHHWYEQYRKESRRGAEARRAIWALLKQHGYQGGTHYPTLIEPETPLTRGSSSAERKLIDSSKYEAPDAVVLWAFQAVIARAERAEQAKFLRKKKPLLR